MRFRMFEVLSGGFRRFHGFSKGVLSVSRGFGVSGVLQVVSRNVSGIQGHSVDVP